MPSITKGSDTDRANPLLKCHWAQDHRNPRDLCQLFDGLFAEAYNTRLVGGAEEPLYQVAEEAASANIIYFTRDYFASALHEVAHWCIAGEDRRRLTDYGYWYEPDGRSPEQQHDFEQVEVRPQALEWIFCCASRFPFRVSADNVQSGNGASPQFKQAIWRQVHSFCQSGLPERSQEFAAGLKGEFGGPEFLDPRHYRLDDL